MKRLFVSISLLLLSVLLLSAKGDIIERKLNVTDFTAIDVLTFYDVEVRQSENCSVLLQVSEEFDKYVEAEVKEGRLVLGLSKTADHFINRIMKNRSDYKLKAVVTLPVLSSLRASGSSDVVFNGRFVQTEKLDVRLSGSSGISGLTAETGPLNFLMTGSSSLDNSSLRTDKLILKVSGASDFEAEMVADELELNASGASKIRSSLYSEKIKVEASGASDLFLSSLKGKTAVSGEMSAVVSGASELNAEDLSVEEVRVVVSGASMVAFHPVGNMSVTATGASSVKYVKEKQLNVSKLSISKGSSLQIL